MQPIVGRYTDKNSKDFIATNGLVPDYPIQSQNTIQKLETDWGYE